MVQLNFNAHDVEPPDDFSPLPEGKYPVVIAASDLKYTKDHSGQYLELEMVVTDGAYRNRKVWTRLNIVNPNPTAQQIAQGHLSAICRAVGVMTPRDSSELHNRPFSAYVVCKQRSDGNGLTNEVKRFEAVEGAATVSTPPAAAAPVAATGTSTPPWTT